MYVCMYACIYACMYGYMYECMSVHGCMYVSAKEYAFVFVHAFVLLAFMHTHSKHCCLFSCTGRYRDILALTATDTTDDACHYTQSAIFAFCCTFCCSWVPVISWNV